MNRGREWRNVNRGREWRNVRRWREWRNVNRGREWRNVRRWREWRNVNRGRNGEISEASTDHYLEALPQVRQIGDHSVPYPVVSYQRLNSRYSGEYLCHPLGMVGSALGLVGPWSVCCCWMREQI